MKKREPWQHEWSKTTRMARDGVRVKWCEREPCGWEMLSRPDSNRYRSGDSSKWMHSPKGCKGEQK